MFSVIEMVLNGFKEEEEEKEGGRKETGQPSGRGHVYPLPVACRFAGGAPAVSLEKPGQDNTQDSTARNARFKALRSEGRGGRGGGVWEVGDLCDGFAVPLGTSCGLRLAIRTL